MKKTILFMSAVAMLAAVSCNKAEIDNSSTEVETPSVNNLVEFVAYTDVETKTSLNGLATEWEGGDMIDINGIVFETSDGGSKATFTADEKPEAPYHAGYPSSLVYNNEEQVEGKLAFNFDNSFVLDAGTLCDDVLAVAYSESEPSLQFKNVVSLLKFRVPEFIEDITEIRISTTETLAGDIYVNYNDATWTIDEDGESFNEIVITSGSIKFEHGNEIYYYVPVLPGEKTNLTVRINGYVAATGKTIEFKRNFIHNLGTLPAPVAEEFVPQEGFVYLKSGKEWKSDKAYFAAYFYGSGGTDAWAKMELVEGQFDIYGCEIPTDFTNVIFCRMNPEFSTPEWDKWEDNKLVEDHLWNQTIDLSLIDGNLYTITSPWGKENATEEDDKKATGEWSGDPAVVLPTVTPGQTSPWSVSGTFNGWGDTPMVTTDVNDLYVAKNVTLDAYASFKIRKDKAWTEGYGGGIVYLNPGSYMQAYKGGSDISNTAEGTFDIYFNNANKYIYLVTAGTDYLTATFQTVDGKEPVQEEPEVTENKLYLKPNANWKKDGARFAAYFFGGAPGEVWVSMTDSDKDGIYELNIPQGYNYGCKVIFCRMNGGTTSNNWNNKWNQTGDLTTPTDGKNLFTLPSDSWDGATTTWSKK